ncbi:MAG: hypothetical protein EAZ92_17150 [Candidatus Kapaibacterium sp.]|nr:MAG: hypothetical protein EAZ92_17150 [Candidatus Kapabacteria bacterium]
MTVQVEIPDGLFHSLQTLAKVSGKSHTEILQSYLELSMNEFFSRVEKERYSNPTTPERGLEILRKYAGNEPPIETDIIDEA